MADSKTNRLLLLGKLHHVVVTRTAPSAPFGIEVDRALLDAAGLLEHEKVDLYDATNGVRLAAELSAGPKGKGDVVVGGPAAQLVQPGDLIVLAAYGWLKEKAAKKHAPRVVFVDEKNRVLKVDAKPPLSFDDVTPTGTDPLALPAKADKAAAPKAAKPTPAPKKPAKDGKAAKPEKTEKKKDKRR